jgi:G3E family GTPase
MVRMQYRVPVIAVTGHLGSGKTTLLNHLLRRPGARIGVVVNDFGAINVDAGLITGQIDAAASIAGGCLCCLEDTGGLDEALERLTQPRLRLDAVLVEASGVAEPGALARLIRFSGAEHVRPGGVVDVVDAVEYFTTLDDGGHPPARFAVASLVVLNKVDRLPPGERDAHLARITARVREINPTVPVVTTSHSAVDPALVYDVAQAEDPDDELPIAALLRETGHHHAHQHAAAVTVSLAAPVAPGRLVDLLEQPPTGAYRLKGTVAVTTGNRVRRYVVNVVGRQVHVASAPGADDPTPGGASTGTPPTASPRSTRTLRTPSGAGTPNGRRNPTPSATSSSGSWHAPLG